MNIPMITEDTFSVNHVPYASNQGFDLEEFWFSNLQYVMNTEWI